MPSPLHPKLLDPGSKLLGGKLLPADLQRNDIGVFFDVFQDTLRLSGEDQLRLRFPGMVRGLLIRNLYDLQLAIAPQSCCFLSEKKPEIFLIFF